MDNTKKRESKDYRAGIVAGLQLSSYLMAREPLPPMPNVSEVATEDFVDGIIAGLRTGISEVKRVFRYDEDAEERRRMMG